MKKINVLIFIILSFNLSATTYYVATPAEGGSDSNPGTLASPWGTWDKAFKTANAGDTVYFRGGVYYNLAAQTCLPPSSGHSGTAGNPICYFAYPPDVALGDLPILDGINKTSSSSGVLFQGASYIHFKGLTVRNNFQYSAGDQPSNFAIAIGNNITIENCVSHNAGFRGFNLYHIDSLFVYNCDSYNTADTLSSTPGNSGDGFIFVLGTHTAADTVKYAIFRGCRAWHNSDDGFDLEPESYIEIDSCWSFNNGYLSGGNGVGFKLGLSSSVTRVTTARKMTNCIAAYNSTDGMTTNDRIVKATPSHIYNNISYHNNRGFVLFETTSSDAIQLTRIYRNNIAYANITNEFIKDATGLYTHDHNSWDISELTLVVSDFESIDSTGITAARQADGSLPNNAAYTTFLHLSEGSQSINQGTDVGYGDDLGAFQYTLAEPPTPPYVATSPPINVNIHQGTGRGIVTDDGGTAVSERGICWDTSNNPLITDNYASSGTTGEGAFTAIMTGLLSNTKYWIKAYAYNGSGTYGDTISVTTPDWGVGYSGGKVVFYNGKIVIVK